MSKIAGFPIRPAIRFAVLMLMLSGSSFAKAQRQELFLEYELKMYSNPDISESVEAVWVFPEGLVELWQRALKRPDAELQRLIIDSIAIAKQRGLKDLGELPKQLVELAKSESSNLDVTRSIAKTLIVLDERTQDALLADMARKFGAPIAEIVEPAIAEWKSPIMKDDWVQRLIDQNASPSMMSLAMEGAAALELAEAEPPLQQIVSNASEWQRLRLPAARALAAVSPDKQLDLAKQLVQERSVPTALNALLAVELVSNDDSKATIEFLKQLLENDNSSVQGSALAHLYRIDFNLISPFCETLITSRDVNVRRWCAKTLIDERNADRVALMSTLLDDVNPQLRRDVAAALVDFGQDDSLRPSVIAAAEAVISKESWRGCEQACAVLAKLDHKPAGPRMVELLGHDRGDVQVAAAWGLTQLRLPELLPDMLEHAQSVYDGYRSGSYRYTMPGKEEHIAHLFTAFGDQKYMAAEPLMMEYVPKDHSLGYESRGAAAWALGLLYEGEVKESLVPILVGRVHDLFSMDPESGLMSQMSAITLGRMKAESALPDLRRYADTTDNLGSACRWSIEQITGEKVPKPERPSAQRPISDWFLMPLPKQ